MGFRADAVVSMQPTSPGLRGADVDAAVAKLEDSGADSVATVLRVEHEHPYWAKRLEGDRVRPFSAETNESYLQRQDLPPAYVFDGAIFVRRRRLLEEWSGRDFGLGAGRARAAALGGELAAHRRRDPPRGRAGRAGAAPGEGLAAQAAAARSRCWRRGSTSPAAQPTANISACASSAV